MADYIYLLQNRLTPAQRQALEAVRDAARTHGMTVFLVGGAVRDLSSGTPVRDLDFAVQGEAAGLIEDLKQARAAVAGENSSLSSLYLIFPGGVRAELGPTLTVTYPKPGQPETQPAAILDDLRRRDFTANAMAISLNEGSYGLLLDPLNGIADMENRELRLVSNYGFIEQPSLLLRAARLTERLGWTLEERTQGRYATAKEEKYIDVLSPQERGYELEEIFHEEDPLAAFAHLRDEGWSDVLFPAWDETRADRDGLDRLRDLMGQMEPMGIHIDPSPVFFPLLTAKLPAQDLAELKASFARPGFVEQVDQLDARSKELAAQMTSKAAAAPSDTWKLLFAAEPEVVLWLAYSSRSSAVQAKFRSFLNEWPQMRQRIPYGLMQEMRITPDLPGYAQLLDDLFFALIDGKLATVEATRVFLEPSSPPAPAPQVTARRRPAKATRSRSKKAAEPVNAADPEMSDSDETEASDTSAISAEFPADSKTSAPATPKTSPAKKRAKETSANAAQAPEKVGAVASRPEAPPPAKAAEAIPQPKKAAPVVVAASGATPKKAAKGSPVKTSAKPVASSSKLTSRTASKTAVAPSKKAIPGKAAATQPKTVAKGTSPGSKAANKTTAAKLSAKKPVKASSAASSRSGSSKAAAKKQTPPGRSSAVANKSAPKKAAKASAKGRSR